MSYATAAAPAATRPSPYGATPPVEGATQPVLAGPEPMFAQLTLVSFNFGVAQPMLEGSKAWPKQSVTVARIFRKFDAANASLVCCS